MECQQGALLAHAPRHRVSCDGPGATFGASTPRRPWEAFVHMRGGHRVLVQ